MKFLRLWFNLPARTRLGIVAVPLLVAAVVLFVLSILDPVHNDLRQGAGIIRFAPIVFLLWLAWADLQSIPRWVWFVAPPVLIFCCIKPAAWFVVIPVTLFALFLMPKKRRKEKGGRRKEK